MPVYTCLAKAFYKTYGLLQGILKITTFHMYLCIDIIGAYMGYYLQGDAHKIYVHLHVHSTYTLAHLILHI